MFKTRTLAATGEVFYMNTARSAWEPFPDAWLAQGEFRDSVVFRTWTRAADNVEFITFQGMGVGVCVCVCGCVCVLWFRRGEVGGALWTSHEVFRVVGSMLFPLLFPLVVVHSHLLACRLMSDERIG